MRKLLLTITLALAFTMPVHPAPFLEMVPSPYPAPPTSLPLVSFNLFFDGSTTPVSTPMVVDASGLQNMKFDLSTLTAAAHTVTAQAVRSDGVVSGISTPPFSFSLVPPATPANLSVQPK